MIRYRQKVLVVSGFYKGQSGEIRSELPQFPALWKKSYLVRFGDTSEFVNEEDLAIIPDKGKVKR